MCQGSVLCDVVKPLFDYISQLFRMLEAQVSKLVLPQLLNNGPWEAEDASAFVSSPAESLDELRINRYRSRALLAYSAFLSVVLDLEATSSAGLTSTP